MAVRCQNASKDHLKLALYEHRLRWVRQVHSSDEGPVRVINIHVSEIIMVTASSRV